eukprot:TRINITY_DN4489_c0_g2_i1.p1 TRINITY_DN4489_c0_g2~~TRINITY_DN4489_c0_g2_i1.p1  ORF type:complete len:260 (+),score=21.58 TRINITY_DN4489_c0_g2_i1:191-970(+)
MAYPVFIQSWIDRIKQWILIAPPGTFEVTGLLGFLGIIVAWYYWGNAPNDDRSGQLQNNQNHLQQQQQQARSALIRQRAEQADGSNIDSTRPIARLIRQRLQGQVRRVTISTLGVVLEEKDPTDVIKGSGVIDGIVEIIQEMLKVCEVYLINQVVDDLSEELIMNTLESSGLIGTNQCQFPSHKILFCSKPEGKVAMARQLESELHIDNDPIVIHELGRFLPRVLFIDGEGQPPIPGTRNIWGAKSLREYFKGQGIQYA